MNREAAFRVPGVVVNHIGASTLQYSSCPSIAVLPSGEYVVSFGLLGKGGSNTESVVCRSRDQGQTWDRIGEWHGQVWSKLFLHRGALYAIGTDHADRGHGRLNGRMVIRRSDDGGHTWTEPTDAEHGLLSDSEGYHTAPVPVVAHRDRLWKAYEFAPGPDRRSWRAFVMSAPEDADLLRRSSWTVSEMRDPWPGHQWIEGNVVVTPDGELLDILRVNDMDGRAEGRGGDETAAILHVSPDGTRLEHNREVDSLRFTGGGTKFTINRDRETGWYLALVNPQDTDELWRNRLVLSASRDLRTWSVVKDLLSHPDKEKHAFQYVDWTFDEDDIVFVSRTAWDDEEGGAARAHDANYITFHRVEGFRRLLHE